MHFSPEDFTKPIAAITNDLRTDGTVASAAIDIRGWNELLLILNIGDTDGALTVSLTESDTSGGSYTAAAAPYDAVFTAIGDAAGAQTAKFSRIKLPTSGLKPFIKVSSVVATSSTGVTYGVTAVLIHPHESALADATFDKSL